MAAVAYDVVNNQLVEKWVFDTGHNANHSHFGQGNHNVMPAAVHPGDPRQSIFLGASAIRYDGQPLWSTRRGHGDAIHVGNFVQGRTQSNGIQIFSCWETSPYGVSLIDGLTGQEIWRQTAGGDTGRAMAGKFLPNTIATGAQFWGSNAGGMYNTAGTRLGNQPGSANFAIWWGGTLERQLLDHTGSSSTTMRIDRVTNVNGDRDRIFTTDGVSINGTKGNPNISADLFGDWREELIVRSGNNIRVYTSPISTDHRITTLMHDPQYRMQVAGQNICYNQPPNPSFYLATGQPLPPIPNVAVRPRGGTVNPPVTTAPVVPAISLTPTGTHTFAGATVGYTAAPAAQTFNVTRTAAVATGAMTVALSGTGASAFELSRTSIPSIAATSNTAQTFTVRPRTGLAAGTYTATVTVSGTGGLVSRTANVSFTVTAATVVTTTAPPVTTTTASPPVTTTVVTTAAPPVTTTPVTTTAGNLNGTLFRNVNVLDTPNRADWSIQNNVQTGQQIFGCSRTFTFATLPAQIVGAEWLRVSGNSKDPQTNIATFTAGADMRLFIGLDSRVTELHELPEWLSGYTLTNMTATTVDGSGNTITFNIYERVLTNGQSVTLGTNGNPFNTMMYTVFGLPAPTSSTTTTVITTAAPPITTTTTGTSVVPPLTTTTVIPPVTTTVTGPTAPPVTTTSSQQPVTTTTTTVITTTNSGLSTEQPATTTTILTTASSPSVTTTTTPATTDELPPVCCVGGCLLGDVTDTGVVTIVDVLEILMYLAGLEDNIIKDVAKARNHSLILPESQITREPTISDVLEILMALAGLESQLLWLDRQSMINNS
jgi:hypothetical protein